MALRSYVTHGQHHVLGNFALDAEVVLLGVLRTHVGLQFAEEQDGAEDRPIHRTAARRIENSIERVGSDGKIAGPLRSGLRNGVVNRPSEIGRTTAEGRLALELFQHQLFHRIVEEPKAGTNCGLSISFGIPGEPDSGRERLVVAGGESLWNTFVARDDQAKRKHSRGIRSGIAAVGIGCSRAWSDCRH